MNYPVLASGVVFGFLLSFGLLKLLKDRRIIELFSDPFYYRILSKEKKDKRKVVEYLEKNKRVSEKKVEKLLGVTNVVAKKYLKELKKDGVIKMAKKKYTNYLLN